MKPQKEIEDRIKIYQDKIESISKRLLDENFRFIKNKKLISYLVNEKSEYEQAAHNLYWTIL